MSNTSPNRSSPLEGKSFREIEGLLLDSDPRNDFDPSLLSAEDIDALENRIASAVESWAFKIGTWFTLDPVNMILGSALYVAALLVVGWFFGHWVLLGGVLAGGLFILFALLLRLTLVNPVLQIFVATRPLESQDALGQALDLVKSGPACEAYRQRVVESGRSMRDMDLKGLARVLLRNSQADESHQVKAMKEALHRRSADLCQSF